MTSEKITKWGPLALSTLSFAVSSYVLLKYQKQEDKQLPPTDESSKELKKIEKKSEERTVIYPIPSQDRGHGHLSRIMAIDDANAYGNVHGGTILKMIGHCGWIAANRWVHQRTKSNSNGDDDDGKGEHDTIMDSSMVRAVLGRMEQMKFREPMFVGELASLYAKITYTSKHSCEVQVDVFAENVVKGIRRHTNHATLWFVSVRMEPHVLDRSAASLSRGSFLNISKSQIIDVSNDTKMVLIKMPQMDRIASEEQSDGDRRYQFQKYERAHVGEFSQIVQSFELSEWMDRMFQTQDFDQLRPGPTVSTLSHVIAIFFFFFF
ncbi:hypothetical protein RFI_11234 [Reticulomyxa filosa]|uniref:HotDog ACOT-type domain-containing protein n=1 Tax=Reticulomyxa filosa TaxID=46433 RepID=X6NJM0_RETFI|nr:hypothetical protein RFI_11234 [Reticulomyxa filosa]|eukprot:ETO25904.1 hypothetical protein RFI_11234 [Reticulomyxa filosa]